MPEEEIIIQNADEVSAIDYMRNTNDMINMQNEKIQNNIDSITEQLDIIIDNTPATNNINNIEMSEVIDSINEIDTTIVESNTQDIISKLNKQEEKINDINEKLNTILNKLEML